MSQNPFLVSKEVALELGFKELPHFTVGNSLIFPIHESQHLCLSNLQNCNETLSLCETDGDRVTDVVFLHTYDRNGKLYLPKLKQFLSLLTGKL